VARLLVGSDEMHDGVDQGQVREGLREVAKVPTVVRVDLFGVEQQGTDELKQFGAQRSSLVDLADLADLDQGGNQPEGADGEGALLPVEAVIGFLDPIPQDQFVFTELVLRRPSGIKTVIDMSCATRVPLGRRLPRAREARAR
jgi:hypothetical protein